MTTGEIRVNGKEFRPKRGDFDRFKVFGLRRSR